MKKLLSIFIVLCVALFARAEEVSDSVTLTAEQQQALLDSLNNQFTFVEGIAQIGDGVATLSIPEGFKFLDAEQSKYVLHSLWGNPESDGTLGMIFPKDMNPIQDNFTYAVEITYSEEGYIEDDDADDIDYEDLLEEMQADIETANQQRKRMGYESVELVGWAKTPYYDSENKKLHWAKEIHFENEETNTLNYNIRVLGRKGYLVLNAIGDMSMLPLFEKDADKIISSVEFNKGFRYSDFEPEYDKVAAYGIGGLIAGKVLAKAGFFAIFAKFFKIIAIGAVAVFGAAIKFFKRKKE